MKKIFLSYSSKTKKCIETLYDDLRENYDVWIDDKLSGGQQWWDEILKRICDCDIFVLTLSRESLDSLACTLEYNYARNLGKQILPVLVSVNVNQTLLPTALKTVQFVDYCNPGRHEAIKLYRAIETLPQSDALPDPLPTPPKVPIQAKEQSVCLGVVTEDLEEERAGVKSYLNQYGIYVLPNIESESLSTDDFRKVVEEGLCECAVFVQLLSGKPGKQAADLPEGYLQLQYEIARNLGKAVFQWRSPFLDVSAIQDKSHQLFVNGGMVRAESIEEFKLAVKEFVLNPPQEPRSRLKQAADLDAIVFVNMESSDRALAEKVCHELQRHGIGYSLPLSGGDPSEIREDLEYNLVESNGIIIIYGSSTAKWVRRQLMEFRKILQKRDKPIQAFAIFEGPPEEKLSIDMMFPNLQLLDLKKGMDDVLLNREMDHFIDNLAKEQT